VRIRGWATRWCEAFLAVNWDDCPLHRIWSTILRSSSWTVGLIRYVCCLFYLSISFFIYATYSMIDVFLLLLFYFFLFHFCLHSCSHRRADKWPGFLCELRSRLHSQATGESTQSVDHHDHSSAKPTDLLLVRQITTLDQVSIFIIIRVYSFVPSFVCLFVCLFPCLIVCYLGCLFVLCIIYLV
jgi:hypothetical protein